MFVLKKIVNQHREASKRALRIVILDRTVNRSSPMPTSFKGLNSILFAINIDNQDLNGPNKSASAVANLLKESTQNVTCLLKESTQGVSTLLKEISTVSAVPSFMRPEPESDRLPVLSKTVNQGK